MSPEIVDVVKLFLTVIVALIGALVVSLKIVDKRIAKNGSADLKNQIQCKPGHSKICQENVGDIRELKTAYGFLKEAIPKLEKKVEDNFKEVFNILRSLK